MSGKVWTPEMDEIVRREWPTCEDSKALASRLGVTYLALKNRAKKVKADRRQTFKPWTAEEIEIVRTCYLTTPRAELSARLGRSIVQIYGQAAKLGVTHYRVEWDDARIERLKELNAAGWSDSDIAVEFGADRHSVSLKRKRLGLPCNACSMGTPSERELQKTRDGVRRQLQRLGLSHLSELRTLAFTRFARDNGWPENLRPRAVQILNLLATKGEPMPRRAIAEGIGMPWRGKNSLFSNGKGGTYLAELMHRDLVVKVGVRRVPGKNKLETLYTLGPAALAILQEHVDALERNERSGQETIQHRAVGGEDASAGSSRGREEQPLHGIAEPDRRGRHGADRRGDRRPSEGWGC